MGVSPIGLTQTAFFRPRQSGTSLLSSAALHKSYPIALSDSQAPVLSLALRHSTRASANDIIAARPLTITISHSSIPLPSSGSTWKTSSIQLGHRSVAIKSRMNTLPAISSIQNLLRTSDGIVYSLQLVSYEKRILERLSIARAGRGRRFISVGVAHGYACRSGSA